MTSIVDKLHIKVLIAAALLALLAYIMPTKKRKASSDNMPTPVSAKAVRSTAMVDRTKTTDTTQPAKKMKKSSKQKSTNDDLVEINEHQFVFDTHLKTQS